MNSPRHWSEDPYWTEALERVPESGTLEIDIEKIREVAFRGDGPAYKLMEAMVSVSEQEGMDGCRGAPRVMLALLVRLSELASTESSD